jgi:hypothetical protein
MKDPWYRQCLKRGGQNFSQDPKNPARGCGSLVLNSHEFSW